MILFPFGAMPPLIGEAEEVVMAEPMGAKELLMVLTPSMGSGKGHDKVFEVQDQEGKHEKKANEPR